MLKSYSNLSIKLIQFPQTLLDDIHWDSAQSTAHGTSVYCSSPKEKAGSNYTHCTHTYLPTTYHILRMEDTQNELTLIITEKSSPKTASSQSLSSPMSSEGNIDNCSTEETEDLSYIEMIADTSHNLVDDDLIEGSEELPSTDANLFDDDLVKEIVVLPFSRKNDGSYIITNDRRPDHRSTIEDCDASCVPSQADTDSDTDATSIGDEMSTGSMTEDVGEMPAIEINRDPSTPKFIEISQDIDNNVYR